MSPRQTLWALSGAKRAEFENYSHDLTSRLRVGVNRNAFYATVICHELQDWLRTWGRKNKIFVESLVVNNFIDSIGSGDVYFSYLIILYFLKNFEIDEKMLICHLASSLHSQSFANSNVISKSQFIKYIKNLIL